MECYQGEKDARGVPWGRGKYFFKDGVARYRGEWKNGLPHGRGNHVYANRAQYHGLFELGKRAGQGTYRYPDGGKYTGSWKNNAKHGFGTFKWSNGKMYVGTYRNDLYEGFGSMKDLDPATNQFFLIMGHFHENQLMERYIPPTLEKSMSYILTWNYFDLGELKELLQHHNIPDDFDNYSHYCEIFERLWVEEVYNDLVEQKSRQHVPPGVDGGWEIETFQKVPQQKYFYNATLTCPAASASYAGAFLQDDIALLVRGNPEDNVHALVKIVHSGRDRQVRIALFLTHKAERPAKMLAKMEEREGRWRLIHVLNMISPLREYTAMSNAWTLGMWEILMSPSTWVRRQRAPRDVAEVPQLLKESGTFNKSQIEAITFATGGNHCIHLLQGPPGTGKTTTIMGILAVLLTRRDGADRNGKIMVCAPSNAAVDELVRRAMKGLRDWRKPQATMLPVRIVRLGRGKKVSADVQEVTLDRLQEKQGGISRRRVIEGADVIFCTLSAAASSVLSECSFPTVIIDEAAQAIELSALIPLQYDCSRCIMVGDPMQLSATVTSRVARDCNYTQSLFSRLQNAGFPAKLLDMQYRMHPSISVFPSKTFYEGRVKDGRPIEDFERDFTSSVRGLMPYQFIHIASLEERVGGDSSLRNPIEAEYVVSLYKTIVASCKGGKVPSIAVITMYRGQVTLLQRRFTALLGPNFHTQVRLNTVDAFQGQEMDVVIVSSVRAGGRGGGIGFVSDTLRMNVALTRAKYALAVVGNANTLCRDSHWRALLEDCNERKCLLTKDFAPLNFDPVKVAAAATAADAMKQQPRAVQSEPAAFFRGAGQNAAFPFAQPFPPTFLRGFPLPRPGPRGAAAPGSRQGPPGVVAFPPHLAVVQHGSAARSIQSEPMRFHRSVASRSQSQPHVHPPPPAASHGSNAFVSHMPRPIAHQHSDASIDVTQHPIAHHHSDASIASEAPAAPSAPPRGHHHWHLAGPAPPQQPPRHRHLMRAREGGEDGEPPRKVPRLD